MDKISKQLVDLCIEECKKQENKDIVVKNILDPLIMHILEKIQPFVIATAVYFITTLVLIIILIAILLWPRG